ncbi:MAG: metal-sensitive transcriptional regulator [Geodermatophilaceae bacterium]
MADKALEHLLAPIPSHHDDGHIHGVDRIRASDAGHIAIPAGGTIRVTPTDAPTNGYGADKDRYPKRLRRVEGQVRGLQRMVEEHKYCIDILTQVSAATKALQSFPPGWEFSRHSAGRPTRCS